MKVTTDNLINKKKPQIGWTIIFAILLIGISLWILSKPAGFSLADDPWKYLGQLTGILGTILLSIEYLLSTRAKFIEKIFGGLDRSYVAHRLIGGIGFVLILYHPFFLSFDSSSLLSGLMLHFLPGEVLSYNLGIFALYAYTALIFLTVYVRLPYNTWKKTHTFMGVPLVIAAYHILTIGSDMENYLPLEIFILTLVSIAICSYLYKRFLYGRFSGQHKYKLEKINTLGEIVEINLKPVGAPMQFIAGQYVFIKFTSNEVAPELHPFSISSAPGEPTIRISIKKFGNFTKSLINLNENDNVTLYGPHGEFGTKSLESGKPEIWIAGGIGVTPFLSLLRYYSRQNSVKNITFFYCAKNTNDFTYKEEINSLASHLGGMKVIFYESDKNGHINGNKIEEMSDGLQGKKIFLCGPKGMMTSLVSEFESKKIHPHNIIFEDFSFLE